MAATGAATLAGTRCCAGRLAEAHRLNPGEPASVASESLDRILGALLEEGPTEDELRRAVTGINARLVRELEPVDGQASTLAEGELYAGDPLFIEQYLEWINEATANQVRDVARTYLSAGWHQVDVVPAGRYAHSESVVDRSTGLPGFPPTCPP